MTFLSIWIGAILPQGGIQFLLCSVICCRCSCSRLEWCLFDSSVFKHFTFLYKKAVNYLRLALQLLHSGSALLSSWRAPVVSPLCCIVFSWSVCFQQQDSSHSHVPGLSVPNFKSFASCPAFCVCPQAAAILYPGIVFCFSYVAVLFSSRIGFQQQDRSFACTIPCQLAFELHLWLGCGVRCSLLCLCHSCSY